MEIGFIGLGRMGGNMVHRLLNHGHTVHAFDPGSEARSNVAELGAKTYESLDALLQGLSGRRMVWVMVPAGDPTENTIQTLIQKLDRGDIIIDGGNSNFRDSMRRADLAAQHGIQFLDAGTSGGVWGLQIGYCLMVGGDPEAVGYASPIFIDLAPEDGFLHVGPAGSGHFVKMVHNGIEYGLLQAYGEGFEVLQAAPFDLDLGPIAELWLHGSVIRSWLLELLRDAYHGNPDLSGIQGYVEDSGEGRWTVEEAIRENVPTPVITLSLLERLRSRQTESYSAKVIAALRNEFGGHAIKRSTPKP